MAKIACDYHKNLQYEGLSQNQDPRNHKSKTKTFLNYILIEQRIPGNNATPINWPVDNEQV